MTNLLVLLGVYVVVVIALGLLATKRAGSTPEEYFLAGRRLGSLVLFMALFGTNCSPFVLVGIPALAYSAGVGAFGLNASIVALGIPLGFWAVGVPLRRMAERLAALTPAELVARRLGSRAVGWVLFALFTLFTLPYMVGGVIGVARTLEGATEGALPFWAGGLAALVVAVTYTTLGGMRATAWTNVVQGLLFLAFMVAAFFLVPASMGGVRAASEAVRELDPALLELGDQERYPLFAPGAFASWALVISFTVIAFPHMLARLMAARDERALKQVCRLYPVALVLLWTPAVMLGVWGAAAFPGLEQPDRIFSLLVTHHMPPWLAPVGALAVVAAAMSTLDAQILTLGSMLSRDVLDPLRDREPSPDLAVREGRWFAVALGALVYLLVLVWNGESVFDVSKLAFEGYVTLVPALFLTVRWRRFTARGALASLAAANAAWLGLPLVLGPHPAGMLPIFWGLVAGAVAGVAASLAGAAPDPRLVERAFGPSEREGAGCEAGDEGGHGRATRA